jgi:DNA-directed RNA polymerase subunit K/omega
METTQSRKTLSVMTKYEHTALIGVRMEQLAFGAPTTLSAEELQGLRGVQEIAREEMRLKRIPLTVTRSLPNSSSEEWSANDLSSVSTVLP